MPRFELLTQSIVCDNKCKFLKTFCCFTLKGQASENLVPILHVWIGLDLYKNRFSFEVFQNFWPNLNLEAVQFRSTPIYICQKTELKYRWTVPLQISNTITWLVTVKCGHEFASASRFSPGSASAFILCGSAILLYLCINDRITKKKGTNPAEENTFTWQWLVHSRLSEKLQ